MSALRRIWRHWRLTRLERRFPELAALARLWGAE